MLAPASYCVFRSSISMACMLVLLLLLPRSSCLGLLLPPACCFAVPTLLACLHEDGRRRLSSSRMGPVPCSMGNCNPLHHQLASRALTSGDPAAIVPGVQVVTPKHERLVKNEGMPISKRPGEKGNLRVHFDIQWPKKQLSESEGQQLHKWLADKY